jgi:uncharacterized repeat protein (TIGR03833 family)
MAEASGRIRSELHAGSMVEVVLKKDQMTGELTRGVVQDILSHSSSHLHGIKVRLQDGQVGRVKKVISPEAE